jgi:hypothetical protein
MFLGTRKKLKRAEYFLNNIKALADEAGGFSYIVKQEELRSNLDGFFFEIISAKDFFLQGINDVYGLGLTKNRATDINQLITKLKGRSLNEAVTLLTSFKTLLYDGDSWLGKLNNYRNSATHRELLTFGYHVTLPLDKDLIDKLEKGKVKIKPIYEGETIEIPADVPRIEVPRENIKTYLFKDPEDPAKGNLDIEVIPYCEASLIKIQGVLEELYTELVNKHSFVSEVE